MTDTKIDHVAEAIGLREIATTPNIAPESAANLLAAAQVHATLAVAEQQRIANLIALGQVRMTSTDLPLFRYLVAEPVGEYDARPTADIREGLGLS